MKGSHLAEGNYGPCRSSGLSPSSSAVREAWTSERGLLWLRKPERGGECPLGQAALRAPRHQASPLSWEEVYLSPSAKSL